MKHLNHYLPLLLALLGIWILSGCQKTNTELDPPVSVQQDNSDRPEEDLPETDLSKAGSADTEPEETPVRMVFFHGTLYRDTGRESTVDGRCGVMDGEITSTVEADETPTVDGQSNFGTGYGIQYGTEDTIEVYLDETWQIFAAEHE